MQIWHSSRPIPSGAKGGSLLCAPLNDWPRRSDKTLRLSLIRIGFLKRLLFLLWFGLCAQALALDPVADATAKFLAGLPVRGTPLESHSTDSDWATHATDLDHAWERLEKQQLSRVRAWAPQFLSPSYDESGPVFYMFSGPDFL